MNTNLFYFNTLNSIGGVETFFYQLAKKYGKDYDITILYRQGDERQVKRLSEYVRVRKYRPGETVRCKRCFTAFNCDLLDFIEADEYIQMLHGDYKSIGVIPNRHEKIQRYIAVSDVVRKSYEDITGDKAVVSHNPYTPEKPRKVLRLVSATRLTPDKGWWRMEVLAHALEEAGVPFTWEVFSDSPHTATSPNIVFRQPRLDILDFIADADYFVQLSDAEGYCYSVVEALCAGTPVIITPFKVAAEIGVEDGKNGFVVPFNMENLPIEAIYKGLKKFKYSPLPDKWDELLLPVPPDYEEEMKKIVKVRCTRIYLDMEVNRVRGFGEEWSCPLGRAELLYDMGLVDIIEE